jgi:Flp pilus assembly protein CpaB
MKRVLPLLVGILLATITGCMVKSYLRRAREGTAGEEVEIAVARRDIEAESEIKDSDLATARVPRHHVPAHVVLGGERSQVVGRKLAVRLEEGRPLQYALLVHPVDTSRVRIGYRAVAFKGSDVMLVGGLLRPHDRVDVVGTHTYRTNAPGQPETETYMSFQDLLVLAVNGMTAADTGEADGRRLAAGTVTLEVPVDAVEYLVHEANVARLQLALRNPSDEGIVDTRRVMERRRGATEPAGPRLQKVPADLHEVDVREGTRKRTDEVGPAPTPSDDTDTGATN